MYLNLLGRSFHMNFKIGPVVLEKKMLTHDARRTTDDDVCQPIAIGHLSDSGDLKILTFFEYPVT